VKGFLFHSRFTPGLKNGEDVAFQLGDVVTYQTMASGDVKATVESPLMQHTTGIYGYEYIFEDTGELGFADERRIIGWDGKA